MDRETWELTQKLRKTPKRIDTLGEANPLTGLLYCADCGSKMYNQRSRGTESKSYHYDVFDYKLAGQKRSAACCGHHSGHHISTKALRTLILDTIRTVSTFAISNQEVFMEKVRSASQLRQEQLKRHRIKSRERYQKIKAGEHAVGQPFTLTCKCCGQEFASKRTNTLFCGPNCRAKFYRQEAAEGRSRACTCENCGKEFITTRSDVKYCSDDCRYQAQIKRQGARKKALREAKNEKETKTA